MAAAAVVLKIFIFLPSARLILRLFPLEHWCGTVSAPHTLDRQTANIIPAGGEPLSAWTNLDESSDEARLMTRRSSYSPFADEKILLHNSR
jgi:hypothetical protein